MQRLLAGDAELRQKSPDRDQAQRDIEFINLSLILISVRVKIAILRAPCPFASMTLQ
jgi:hypothetical protein